jgi:hypothetical protein
VFLQYLKLDNLVIVAEFCDRIEGVIGFISFRAIVSGRLRMRYLIRMNYIELRYYIKAIAFQVFEYDVLSKRQIR